MIRVGIGGWTFPPWRGAFYPEGLAHAKELGFASRHVTAIEINGTYYGSQRPESFARWHDEAPDGFVFAVKGPRFCTNRRKLAEAGTSVERFITGGVTRLGPKLGPINWQFLPTKTFDAEDFAAFLALLPKSHDGIDLRHVVELRHASFRIPGVIDSLRARGIATVLTDNPDYPHVPDITAPFTYVRLQCAREDCPTGYDDGTLKTWAARAASYVKGAVPRDLEPVAPASRKATKNRDVFVFMINGHKPHAPKAATRLLELLQRG